MTTGMAWALLVMVGIIGGIIVLLLFAIRQELRSIYQRVDLILQRVHDLWRGATQKGQKGVRFPPDV